MSGLDRRWFPHLLGCAFLLQIVVMMLRIAMTYEALSIGLGGLWVGIIGSAFGAGPAILALHVGSYIDRFGERVALLGGASLALTASLGLWLAPPSAAGLLALSTVTGFAQLIGAAAQHSATGKTGGARQAGNFGHLTMVISLAQTIGPLMFGILADTHAGLGSVFGFATLASLVLLVMTLPIRPPTSGPGAGHASPWRTAGAILRTPGYVAASVASLVLFMAMDLLVIYLPLFGTERGLSPAAVGVLLALRGAASVLSRLFFGYLYRTVGRTRLVVSALFCSGAAITTLPLMPALVAMGILAFIAGLALGIGAPLTLAWITEIIPAAMLGSALSLRLAINRIGQATMPVALGAAITGPSAGAIIAAIGCSLLAGGVLSRIAERTR